VVPGESGLGAVTPLPLRLPEPREDPEPLEDRGAATLAHHRMALDAIEEIARAPAQASLLLELCVERARALVRGDGAAVELLEDEDELLFAATSGMLRDQLGAVQPVPGTLCGTAVRTGAPLSTADAQLDLRGNREAAAALGIRAAVWLPLYQERRRIGVLLVVSERAGAFSDEDVDLLTRLARVASARLDYALARDATRRSEAALAASRQKYRTVLASIDSGILALDDQDQVVLVNPAAERILGQPAYELIGRRPPWTVRRPDGTAWPAGELPVRVAQRERRVVADAVLQIRRSDGQFRWLNATVSPLPEAGDGRGPGVVICFSDITERREEAERLRHSERLLAETQQLAQIGSWDYDLAGGRMTWTDEMYRLVGLVPGSIPPSEELCLAVTHPEDRAMLRATSAEALRRGGRVSFGVRALLGTGEVRHLQLTGEVRHGPTGRAVRAWGSAQDVTERHRIQEELRRLALTDSLTGLGNRLHLIDRLTAAIRGIADGRHVAVVCVDLDGLKAVNDTHGHATGDELLRETAARLRSVLREGDTAARFGGDEFVLVCAGVDPLGADQLGERIVTEISAPYHLSGGIIAWAGASVGVTVTGDPDADLDKLLAQADRALYAAKAGGGNRYAVG
jgi:diguanylate cyclase (GGDEF)-like protein/PAS domain S-box-containing protein